MGGAKKESKTLNAAEQSKILEERKGHALQKPVHKPYFPGSGYVTQQSVAKPNNGGNQGGSATTIQDKKDDNFIENTNKEIELLLANEKLLKTITIVPGKWETYQRCRKPQPYEKSYEKYCNIVKNIGHKMWMAWSKMTELDGTPCTDFPADIDTWPDLKDTKPRYRREDDDRMEYLLLGVQGMVMNTLFAVNSAWWRDSVEICLMD